MVKVKLQPKAQVRSKNTEITPRSQASKRGAQSGTRGNAVAAGASTANNCSVKGTNANCLHSCAGCGIYITEDTKALQCDRCLSPDAWKCVDCLHLSAELYDQLDENCTLKWFCEQCDKTVMEKADVTRDGQISALTSLIESLMERFEKMERSYEHIEEKVDGVLHRLDSKITKTDQTIDMHQRIENKVDNILYGLDNTVADTDQVKEVHQRIEQKVDALVTNVEKTAVGRDNVEDLVRTKMYEDKIEEEEQWKRKTSVIVHGLEEPRGSTPEERKHEDEETIITLLHSLNLDDISVDNIIRLGKRPEQVDAKPRPIKVVIASEEQKLRVLSKAKNLPRKGEGETNGIFMHQDLTPKQRVRRQELVKELKSRQSQGEKNLIIVNWKIVERRNVKKDEV